MKQIVSTMLLLAAGSAGAAPVSLSLEALEWYRDVGFGDNTESQFSLWTAQNCLSTADPLSDGSCTYTSRTYDYSVASGVYGGVLYGAGTVGMRYQSAQQITDHSFSLEASSLVFASSSMPLNPDELPYETVNAIARQSKYLLEFEVLEQVVYEGTAPLTDGLFDFDDPASQPFGLTGNIYESGAVLEAGIYQYWAGCLQCSNLGSAPELPGTSWLLADLGQNLYDEDSKVFEFHFTVVPIPPALFLFPSALAALAWFRRRSL